MTKEEKRWGLGSLLSMSCRGSAEAFARRLHNRLRSLGSQDGSETSESNCLSNNEPSNGVTSFQPRHIASENKIYVDFGLLDTPGSPEEEVIESELTKFITNPTDDLHHLNLDECVCMKENSSCNIAKKNSIDSNSSDGLYYDTEIDQPNSLRNHLNGISHNESRVDEENFAEEVKCLPSEPLSSSENTIFSLSRNIKEGNKDCVVEKTLDDRLEIPVTSGWSLSYDPQKISNKNNNIYSAIDLESLKRSDICISQEEICSNEDSNESTSEYYCSHLNIQQDLTIECPNSASSPIVQVAALEIQDIDESQDESLKKFLNLEINGSTENTNHLKVQGVIPENDNDTEIEDRIPRVRRCSSLKTGKTPPGTPGRKKIVRFADVLGLDLADVRTFLDEIPKVPISAYEDLSGIDLSLSDTSLCSNSLTGDSVHTSSKTLMSLFQQPGGEANFMDKIRSRNVCLENAVCKDDIALCVSGTVRVRNLDFNKSVHIRYSLDSWKSYADLQATYMEGSCDGFSDKFSFTLYVHTLGIGQKLEFAIRFQCKGCQYWDNNAGKNYVFQCLPVYTTSSYVPVTTPDDSNWAGAAFY